MLVLDVKFELILFDKILCRKSLVNYNVIFSKGVKVGKYYKMVGIKEMDGCVKYCFGMCDSFFFLS